MTEKPKYKMSIENRAKQFMPFAALKGFPEALAAKEKGTEDNITLTPEREEESDEPCN